jgi:hypothetical protein
MELRLRPDKLRDCIADPETLIPGGSNRETEFPFVRSQTEFGNEGTTECLWM